MANENGSVAVFVAAVLMVLMGVLALALDGGLLQLERASAQAAADVAAMAAAWEECAGTSDPTSAALASAATNGFDNAVDNTVTINKTGAQWEVTIASSRKPAAFSRVWGNTDLDTGATAVAECQAGSGGGYAIYGDSTACNNAVNWSGSTSIIDGAVHSNNDIHVGGSSNTVNGPATYVSGSPPGGVNWNGGISQVSPRTNPLAHITMADYAPGGAKASLALAQGKYFNYGSSAINLSGTIPPGLYYTTGNIKLNGSTIIADGATFVSDGGTIDLSGASDYLRPWDPDGILVFTTYVKNPAKPKDHSSNCNSPAVKISGSSHDWEGIIYAPNGKIDMSGSQNTALKASLVANTVSLSGSSKHISGWDGWALAPPSVGLVH